VLRTALAAALLLALSPRPGAAADADKLAAYGRHLAQECAACHRADGVESAIPPLAGKPEADFIVLLRAYREGRKTNPVMVSVANSLNEEEMAALAAYFAGLPRPASVSPR